MSAMASQITGISTVYSTVCSGADKRKFQSSASLAFVRGIHRWPVNSPYKGPVTRKKHSIWWCHHDVQYVKGGTWPTTQVATCSTMYCPWLHINHTVLCNYQHLLSVFGYLETCPISSIRREQTRISPDTVCPINYAQSCSFFAMLIEWWIIWLIICLVCPYSSMGQPFDCPRTLWYH